MEQVFSFINNRVFLTIILVMFFFVLKNIVIKIIQNKNKEKDNRNMISMTQNIINLLTLIFVFSLWSSEIQNFAISIAAFTVAIVIATREIIQSIIGFIYITSSRTLRVGDWIKVDNDIGEIITIDWLKVTTMEIDSKTYEFTGKTKFFANGIFLTNSICNLNVSKNYINYSFNIVKDDINKLNPFIIKEKLLEKIEKINISTENIADKYKKIIEKKLMAKVKSYNNTININTSDTGKIIFNISILCKTNKVKEMEQEIIKEFFNIYNNECSLIEEKLKKELEKIEEPKKNIKKTKK